MCVVQHYTRWHCGCFVDAEAQALVNVCAEKLSDPGANCKLYVVPPYDEDMAVPAGYNGEHGNGPQRSGDDESSDEEEASAHENGNDSSEDADGEWDLGCITSRGYRPDDRSRRWDGRNPEQYRAVVVKGQGASHEDENDGDGDEDDDDDDEDDEDGGMPCRRPVTSPRMCAEHESTLERAARAYWQSEMLWLRPKLLRKGWLACRDMAYAQRCANRLWDVYHVWKFFNGGDQRGAAIAASRDFCPPLDRRSGDVDDCATLQRIFCEGDADYRALQWGLDDLLEALRGALHPREMIQ